MDPKAGLKVTDKVRLVRLIGTGAMGSVWLAEHATLKTEVAVKFMAQELTDYHPDAVKRFAREATAAAQLKSPHVVRMFDHGVMDDGTAYIVMELLDGESLSARIKRGGWLPPETVSLLLDQVAHAVGEAHARGVIHRDIKPDNIYLTEVHGKTFAKVLDFGIAKHIEPGDDLTEPGTIVGTPRYMCRDLIVGGDHTTVNEQVDLWSMAVVAYRALTTTLPFKGDTVGKICAALTAGKFTPPSELRPELGERYDRWFARALHVNPNERFGSAQELADTFRALLDADDDSAEKDHQRARRQSQRRSRQLLVGALAVGGLALGVYLGYRLYPDETSMPGPPATSGATTLTGSRPSTGPSSGPATTVAVPVASVNAAPPSSSQPVASSAPVTSATVSPAVPEEALRNMMAIPAGTFWMGCHDDNDLDCHANEVPGRKVTLRAFHIDRTEVRVSDYAKCVVAGECSDRRLDGYTHKSGVFTRSSLCNWGRPHGALHPINCISHPQAQRYCEWRGARLPSEAEWERAARGDDRRRYPWGSELPSCLFAVMADQGDKGCGRVRSWAVGSKPRDSSPFGVLDMAGNVKEWVADWYDKDYYRKGATRDPAGPEHGFLRVARGGSWGTAAAKTMRVSARNGFKPDLRSVYIGFRCALSSE